MSKPSVCLNMIVKDEAHVIRRCLESVIPHIDAWVIVDTGSADGTQALVREILAGVPGELHQRPWVDFAHNRNQAIRLAAGRGDYLLFIDADEVLRADPGFALPPLVADAYWITVDYAGCSYQRKQLVRNTGAWKYVGVVHEYLACDRPASEARLSGIVTVPRHDGARARDPHTYRRDAALLERSLRANPRSTRDQFYLAQTWRDAGEPERALEHYRKRVAMGGWAEEVWYSLYQVGVLKERLGHPWPEVMAAYLAAFEHQCDRAEPLVRIGMHYQAMGEHRTAHLFLARAAALPPPGPERLFAERELLEEHLPRALSA
ncbi:MAG TPA: glycosyltransferase, partial [Longimicrobiaceae bacterium]|nr:glycosyltransferase [Longimicrobiaceae bacterium]